MLESFYTVTKKFYNYIIHKTNGYLENSTHQLQHCSPEDTHACYNQNMN